MVADIDETFLPLPDDLLVNLESSRAVVEALLDSLPQMFAGNHTVRSLADFLNIPLPLVVHCMLVTVCTPLPSTAIAASACVCEMIAANPLQGLPACLCMLEVAESSCGSCIQGSTSCGS